MFDFGAVFPKDNGKTGKQTNSTDSLHIARFGFRGSLRIEGSY